MKFDFYDLIDKWLEMNDLKSAYCFAEEELEECDFTQTVQQTFQAIKQFKSQVMDINNHASDIQNNLFGFSQLLVELAKYSVELDSVDESDECIFSASQAIVRLLINYATMPGQSETDKNDILYGNNEECGIFPNDEDYCDWDYWDKIFSYDTNACDMSEIIELAKHTNGIE